MSTESPSFENNGHNDKSLETNLLYGFRQSHDEHLNRIQIQDSNSFSDENISDESSRSSSKKNQKNSNTYIIHKHLKTNNPNDLHNFTNQFDQNRPISSLNHFKLDKHEPKFQPPVLDRFANETTSKQPPTNNLITSDQPDGLHEFNRFGIENKFLENNKKYNQSNRFNQQQAFNFNEPPHSSSIKAPHNLQYPPPLINPISTFNLSTNSLQQQSTVEFNLNNPPPLLKQKNLPNSSASLMLFTASSSTTPSIQQSTAIDPLSFSPYQIPLHTIPPPKPLSLSKIPPPRELDLTAIPEPTLNLDAIKIPDFTSISTG